MGSPKHKKGVPQKTFYTRAVWKKHNSPKMKILPGNLPKFKTVWEKTNWHTPFKNFGEN